VEGKRGRNIKLRFHRIQGLKVVGPVVLKRRLTVSTGQSTEHIQDALQDNLGRGFSIDQRVILRGHRIQIIVLSIKEALHVFFSQLVVSGEIISTPSPKSRHTGRDGGDEDDGMVRLANGSDPTQKVLVIFGAEISKLGHHIQERAAGICAPLNHTAWVLGNRGVKHHLVAVQNTFLERHAVNTRVSTVGIQKGAPDFSRLGNHFDLQIHERIQTGGLASTRQRVKAHVDLRSAVEEAYLGAALGRAGGQRRLSRDRGRDVLID
jgi:hypothetical protein